MQFPRIIILLIFSMKICKSEEFKYEMIKEPDGTILYGHYVDEEKKFKIYDHKNNRFRMAYVNVEKKDLNIIGEKTVTIQNPVKDDGIYVNPVLRAATGQKKNALKDVYISRWELSDDIALYHLKKIIYKLPKGDNSIGVMVFKSNKENFIHVITYQENKEEDMVKIDEFEHDLNSGMIYSGRLEDGKIIYLDGGNKITITRTVNVK
jgi:hypothetical protein